MTLKIDGYSVSLTAAELLDILHEIDNIPRFDEETATITVLEDGSINILITEGKAE